MTKPVYVLSLLGALAAGAGGATAARTVVQAQVRTPYLAQATIARQGDGSWSARGRCVGGTEAWPSEKMVAGTNPTDCGALGVVRTACEALPGVTP